MAYEPRRIPWQEDVTLRGLRHRLTWWGERTATPVFLLHGFMDCGTTWQFLVDCLPREWSFVAPDWRGFGDSEWPAGGYWFPDYLADLETLLEMISGEASAAVIAHSMGANIATLYAGIRPRRLRWLANLEGLGLSRTQPSQAPERYTQWLDELRQPLHEGGYKSVRQLADTLARRNPRLGADRAEFVARAWSRPVTAEEEDGAPGEAVRLRFDPRHRLVNPVLYRREEAEVCWSRIEAPMLLVEGAQSNHRTRHGAAMTDEALHSQFRDLRIVKVADAGHMMHHENPETVARHIVAFVRERDRPAA